MTAEVVSAETGEVISHADVRDSIAIARSHGEKFFEQIVWQVENEVWGVLGYKSWDDMRGAEYADLGVVAPKSDRPELTSRLRSKGLTQKQIGDTLGVSDRSVRDDLSTGDFPVEPTTVTNSRGQERPAAYERREPDLEDDGWTSAGEASHKVTETTKTETYVNGDTGEVVPPPQEAPKSRRRPLPDQVRDAGWELDKAITRLQKLSGDDRFITHKKEVAPHLRSHLNNTVKVCQDLLDQLN